MVLLSILAFAPAARATLGAPAAAAAAPADVRAQARALLRAIRAEAQKTSPQTADLRRRLQALLAKAADPADARLQRAAEFLDRLEQGKPLPPPGPEEGGSDEDKPLAAHPDALSPPAASAPKPDAGAGAADLDAALAFPQGADAFDGGRERGAKVEPVELEPAAGYHTVNADAWLSLGAKVSAKDRDALLRKTLASLLAKAGVADPADKRAKALAALVGERLRRHPLRAAMRAVRLRADPDGHLVLVCRLSTGGVFEEDLGTDLAADRVAKVPKKKFGRRKKPKPAKKKKEGGDEDGEGAGKSGGKRGKGGAGGGAGTASGGRGAAGARKNSKHAKGGDAEDSDGDAIMPLARKGGSSLDPDGRTGKGGRGSDGARSAGAKKTRTAFDPAAESAAAPRKDAGGAERRGKVKGGKDSARASKGAQDPLDALPGLTHLSGDRPHGHPGLEKSAVAGVPAAEPAGAAAPARAAAAESFAAGAVAPAAADAPFVRDEDLRDAVAGDAVPSPPPSPRAAAAPRAETPIPAGAAAAPEALFMASAALGLLGLRLSRGA